jgi:hypothetical protein
MPAPPRPTPTNPAACTRAEFLCRSAQGLGSLALLSALPARSFAADPAPPAGPAPVFDLREFVHWITAEFEPSVRLPGGAGRYARAPGETTPELYGVADMACILHTLGALHPTEPERAEWAAAFQAFQTPDTGWLVEKSPTHDPLHNTAFALAAMQLLDLAPARPVRMDATFADPKAFLATLDWRTAVYLGSHRGAGVGAIHALVPALADPAWFAAYFAACDGYFDPASGLMGVGKPPGGDADQVGGTFHYSFLYEHFNRHLPYPEARIDAVLRTQQPDGYWRDDNHLWLTLDAIYLLTRSLRICTHRFEDVRTTIRRIMALLMRDLYSPAGRRTALSPKLPVHSVTAAISIAAEAQKFLGAQEVVTDRPLRLVLDRRPFI